MLVATYNDLWVEDIGSKTFLKKILPNKIANNPNIFNITDNSKRVQGQNRWFSGKWNKTKQAWHFYKV